MRPFLGMFILPQSRKVPEAIRKVCRKVCGGFLNVSFHRSPGRFRKLSGRFAGRFFVNLGGKPTRKPHLGLAFAGVGTYSHRKLSIQSRILSKRAEDKKASAGCLRVARHSNAKGLLRRHVGTGSAGSGADLFENFQLVCGVVCHWLFGPVCVPLFETCHLAAVPEGSGSYPEGLPEGRNKVKVQVKDLFKKPPLGKM